MGLIRAGWLGLIAAGGLFIIPGTAAIILVAWAYVKYGSLPQVGWGLYGVKPAVIAIIIVAIWSLARKGIKSPLLIIVGLGVLVLYLFGINEIALLLGGAVIFVLIQNGRRLIKQKKAALMLAPTLLLKFPLVGLAASTSRFQPGYSVFNLSQDGGYALRQRLRYAGFSELRVCRKPRMAYPCSGGGCYRCRWSDYTRACLQ